MCAFNGKVDYGRVHLVVKGWPSPFHSDAAAVVYRGPIFTPPPLLLRVRIVCDRPWGWLECPDRSVCSKDDKAYESAEKDEDDPNDSNDFGRHNECLGSMES